MSNNTLRRFTIQSLYTRLQFCICNTKVAIARAALCVVLCAVYCVLVSVLIRVPPLKFPSLPMSLPPTLLPCTYPSLRCSLRPRIIASSFPHLAPTLPHHSLAHSHPPSFPVWLSPAVQFNVHRMCVWQAALYCVAPSDAWHWDNRCSRQKKLSFQWPAVTFSERAPTANPFLTTSKKADDRLRNTTVYARTFPWVSAATPRAF